MEFLWQEITSRALSSMSRYLLHPRKPTKESMTKTSPPIAVRANYHYDHKLLGLKRIIRNTLAKELLGEDLYNAVSSNAIALYKEAASYALSRGLILADTKFEFGLIPASSSSPTSPSPTLTVDSTPYKLILIDEALTPDSSRYWSAAEYAEGRSQSSFDKQFLRDWLTAHGFKKGLESGPPGHEGEGWSMTDEVVEGTRERYEQVIKLLTE